MIKRWRMLLVALATMLPLLATAPAHADCVDINADPVERLVIIAHIDDERAVQLIAGRPWPSVRSLTGINGIGRGRIRDILEQDLACVGVRAPRGQPARGHRGYRHRARR
jgi:DNA uptake protein ComE-like DNA-binding protein